MNGAGWDPNISARPTVGLPYTARETASAWPVALVAMPFLATESPSIQLGLLKSIGVSHGFPVTTFHFNLDFAAQIGAPSYDPLCRYPPRCLGDWLFSAAAFAMDAPDLEDRRLDQLGAETVRYLDEHGLTRDRLRAIRHQDVPRYLDGLVAAVPWERFRVVGFSCCFEQNMASFALARRLKDRWPDITLVFGGANFDGEMGHELVRSVACIDYAVIGEGDLAFPELLTALAEGRDPAEVPSVVCRRDGKPTAEKARPLFDRMDDLPVPDYDEFFARHDSLEVLPRAKRRALFIPFETSRGCWWGAKQHCTFCGLIRNGMPFRAKSPERVLAELAELSRRHRKFNFFAVDNILDLSYLEHLFERLTAEGHDYEFFFEVKSNLTRAQIKTLFEGGVRHIQPGIESLSSHVLQLMRKGVTAIQNVNTLRWVTYYDIQAEWNVIYGFPGETLEDYRKQAALLPHLVHLQPPDKTGRISMQRFSPIHTDRKSFPARYVRADETYRYVYPKGVDLDRAVYFFDYELEGTLPDYAFAATVEQVRLWREAWEQTQKPRLTFRRSPGFIEIADRRDPSAPRAYSSEEPLASLYAACSDEPHTAAALQRTLGLDWPVSEIEESLDDFCTHGLMMREGNRFLSLALPASRWR